MLTHTKTRRTDFLMVNRTSSQKYQKEKQKKYIKNPSNEKAIFNNGVLSRHVLISFPFDEEVYNQIGLIDFNTSLRTKNKKNIVQYRTKYKLNAPYIHQLRQRFVAYFGKYGVPNIPDSLRVYNLKKLSI